ncbi:MAG TPA: tetratricopeptide repeat protein [Steroidobacteraceae bacterium]|nr:tetratricopeptide repeat protein [Steroidobacteraceae bacterium]
MIRKFGVIALSALVCACSTSSTTEPADATPERVVSEPASPKLQAPLFNDLGNYSSKISTKVPLTQRFFDQGLMLTFGFNHAEAARSFREAARLDPSCAMCYWGVAFVLGPNINMPMFPEAYPEAWSASRKALELAGNATPRERALIEALAKRYVEKAPEDRSALDKAFADAMREVVRQYPDDYEVQTFFAESLMDLSPWDYWKDGQPKPATVEIIAALERVLNAFPNHAGANHLYIHALEASPNPGRAESAADRLLPLAPGAGHLVHMPGHIYMRVGRYHDAGLVNIKAGEADMSYIAQCQAQGVYPLLYHPHNWHFLWFAASFSGNSAWAQRGAKQTRELMGTHKHDDPAFGPIIQHFWLTPLYDDVRFGRWDSILATSEPEDSPYVRGAWHYARGMALSAKGDANGARQELDKVRTLAQDPKLPAITVSVRNNGKQLVDIAAKVLEGDIAARARRYGDAIAALTQAVALEDKLGYNEPEDWHMPTRHMLGAVLLDAGKAAEAEKVYRDELAHHTENGWSLKGLALSLRAQGKEQEAAAVEQRFQRAWSNADVQLSASVIR